MIKGAEQAFKFTTSCDFDDICNIVAVFSQPHNVGTDDAPMPIYKYYNRQITDIEEWDIAGKEEEGVYRVGTKYYRYDSDIGEFVASGDRPTESDICGGAVTEWPLSNSCHISNVYKCDESYYRYNPNTEKWDITTTEPSMEPTVLEQAGAENIGDDINKKRPCVYNKKYYKCSIGSYDTIDTWTDEDKDISKVYYAEDTSEYYLYKQGEWTSTDDISETSDDCIVVETWAEADADTSKIYYAKDTATYHYYSSDAWASTNDVADANDNYISVDTWSEADKDTDKIYYSADTQLYYIYNDGGWISTDDVVDTGLCAWVSSTTPAPVVEIPYWYDNDDAKFEELDNTKTYCARETYYKCIDDVWHRYGSDCVEMVYIYAWDDDAAGDLDKSKVYVFKEFYYEYNEEAGDFDKVAANEVYYKYCKTESGAWEWVEIDDPNAKPKIEAKDVGLWVDGGEYDENTTYVCKNIYYSYNSETTTWDSSDIFRLSVVEVAQWSPDEVTYDPTKIYMCPAKYYQYNIEKSCWEEVDKVEQPKIESLNYWSDADNRDKNKIYLCGPTYYQYDSAKEQWVSSSSLNITFTKIALPSEAVDQSKLYECSPVFYAYKGGAWVSYKTVAEAVRNDGFTPVDGDPKSFVIMLSAEETMRFIEKYKGCVQATVYCDKTNRTDKSKVEYFTVYPTMTDEIFSNVPSGSSEMTRIFDAGEII